MKGFSWESVRRQAAKAAKDGALHRFETAHTIVEDGGVPFIVRSLTAQARAQPVSVKPTGGENPFATPEPALFAGDLTRTHYALLNKFPVIEPHLLIVTRAYVPQEAPLDLADFEALELAMEAGESKDGRDEGRRKRRGAPARAGTLGFYNSGRDAGASQGHKHLQVVPLPLGPFDTPIAERVKRFRFRHAFARLERGARRWHAAYRALHEELVRGAPYNLLVTDSWMLLVPRSHERCEGIAVNALGFAGSLFVRDDEQLETVRRLGPLALLRSVAIA